MAKLLIDEYPLMVLPSLAKMIGLNEAIALQQVHYWLNNAKGGVVIDGVRWVYNTYEEWQSDNFPFWSVRTVTRVFTSLETMELLLSMQKASYDRKKYYRVHYDKLALWNETTCHNAEFQNGTMDDAKVAPSLTETTPETTPENIISAAFVDFFGRFYGKKEETRWNVLYESVGHEKAEKLIAWAFKKEIHLTNRGGLLDSLETAAKNWKMTQSTTPPSKGAVARKVAANVFGN